MLTRLEAAVLEMILDKRGEPYQTIQQQLSYATVANRKLSGVGFFTHFTLPPNVPVRRDLKDMTIGDVGAKFPNLKHGAGFILFIREGSVQMLEGYTYDESWPENSDDFKLFRMESPKTSQ